MSRNKSFTRKDIWNTNTFFDVLNISMVFRMRSSVFYDAAYIAAWMIDYCNLIGRKVVFEPPRLIFKAVLHSFPNESELWGSIASSMKFTCFLSVTKVQNLGMFSPIMSTKCKIFSRILYADQKRNIQLKLFFLFFPSVWLDFIARVYNNGH